MPDKRPEPIHLIFQWLSPDEEQRGLLKWIIVSLVGLVAFFYIFQVVYPPSRSVTPVPQHVVLLDRSDPAARVALDKMSDRDFLMLPPADDLGASDDSQVADPVFRASFEGHQLALQDLPLRPYIVPPARLITPAQPVLPPLDLKDLSASTIQEPTMDAQVRYELRVVPGGDLAQRKLLNPADFAEEALTDPEAAKFQLVVAPTGVVTFALPISAADKPEVYRSISSKLERLRFEPLEAEGNDAKLVVGMVTFQWVLAPARDVR